MNLLKNQVSIKELFNHDTFDVLESVKMLKYIQHINKVECSVLNNKDNETILNSKLLNEKQKLRNEIENYQDGFSKKLNEKLENRLLECCLYMTDPNIDGWIDSLQKFDMEMNFSSSLVAKNKSVIKIIEITNAMIKNNPEYGFKKDVVMNEILSTSINRIFFEKLEENKVKNKMKFS